LRRAELLSLDMAGLTDDVAELRVAGKGDRERCVPIPAAVRESTLRPLLDSDNALRREAAGWLLTPGRDADSLRPASAGAAWPVGGDAWLGARLACRGDGPWEWGIAAHLNDTTTDWRCYGNLIGSDGAPACLWAEYARRGERPAGMTWRLHEIAREPDEARAHAAISLLWALQGQAFVALAEACFAYHGVTPGPGDGQRVRDVLRGVLVRHTPSGLVASLAAPNPSACNPLGEGLLYGPEDGSSPALDLALSLGFMAELPAALGMVGLELPPESSPAARRSAIGAEWRHLMAFQDMAFGFWVKPRLELADLLWYCRARGADPAVKRVMINYLACACTVLPQLRSDRAVARRCLYNVFLPLLNRTVIRLRDVGGGAQNTGDLREAVQRELGLALGAYDALWAEPDADVLPLGPLSATPAASSEARPASGQGSGLVHTHLPLTHYLQKRLNRLVVEARAEARRSARAAVGGDKALATAENEGGYRAVQARTGAINAAQTDKDVVAVLAGANDRGLADAPGAPTFRLDVGGQPVECYDIATVASLLGASPGALRQRERRGKLRFPRHEGCRYLPVAELAEVGASLQSNEQLARDLGVSERTVRRWKEDAPDGLSALAMVEYLRQRAAARGAQEGAG
jgi:hypothetical protein